jgi:hypothetical protein
MRLAILLVAGSFLCVAAPAQATRLVTTEGQPAQPFQRWADRAKVPTAPAAAVIRVGLCPGLESVGGCYRYDAEGDSVYLRDPTVPLAGRFEFFHELGHMYDDRVLTDQDRATFLRTMGYGSQWWTKTDPPAERFADAYALCAMWRRPTSFIIGGDYGYRPTPRQYRRVCALIRS